MCQAGYMKISIDLESLKEPPTKSLVEVLVESVTEHARAINRSMLTEIFLVEEYYKLIEGEYASSWEWARYETN